jgi:15-cis-phytoene synthase
VSPQLELEQAYRHCEAVTRAQAANFFYGIRLLPAERRRAMCAVYTFARRVDDIGDGTLAPDQKLRLLDAEDQALASLAPGAHAASPGAAPPGEHAQEGASNGERRHAGADPVMVALADSQLRFPIAPGVLGELIDGVRMDLAGTTYDSFDELVVYCRRVAGAIGRVCLAIFGLREEAAAQRASAEQLADELGVALQLTNILRDVREDALAGRVYLPGEDLRRFGVAIEVGVAAGPVADSEQLERLSTLVRFECERAREWFERGMQLTDMLDRRSAACVLAMAGIYRRLLERIAAHPEAVAHRRLSLPAHEKAWVAARGMLGVGA